QRDHHRDPLARVVAAVERDADRAAVRDLDRADRTPLDRFADRSHPHAGTLCERRHESRDLVEVAVLGEPVSRVPLGEPGPLGIGDSVDVGDDDLVRHVAERVLRHHDDERVLVPHVVGEREGHRALGGRPRLGAHGREPGPTGAVQCERGGHDRRRREEPSTAERCAHHADVIITDTLPEMPITIRELDRKADRRGVEAIDTTFETSSVFDLVTTPRRIELVERRLERPLVKTYSIGEVFAHWARWDTGWVAEDGAIRGVATVAYEAWHARLIMWHFYVAPEW